MSAPRFTVRNPRTGVVGQSYDTHGLTHVEQVLAKAHDTYQATHVEPVSLRVSLLHDVSSALRQNRSRLAELASLEMGKLMPEALAEVDKCASLADYLAGALREGGLESRNETSAGGPYTRVSYRPLGVILGVMPWNYPHWQAVRFILPAIAAGNAAVLKHAPNVPGCAEALTDVLREIIGDRVHNLRIGEEKVAGLIADSRIAGVSVTASTRAGSAVAELAGKHLKPTVLELGGSDAYLVLADADLDRVVETCFAGRLLNAGQSCISPKRLIVHESLVGELTERLAVKCERIRYAHPDFERDSAGHLAPLARPDLRAQLHAQVERSVTQGARLYCGGVVPGGAGNYYPPTLLSEVQPGQAAFDEELFGPVFALTGFAAVEDAIRLANRSRFGLGGGVFSRDVSLAEQIASERLVAGSVAVNDVVRSDPRLPFGGVKESGYGRELGVEGLRAFTSVKTVSVARYR